MAAVTITPIMQGIVTRLNTISGLRTAAFRPDQVNPPQAYVRLPQIEYHAAFAHGLVTVEPIVTVLISRVSDSYDQIAMASYMDVAGSNSIHAAIEGDKTLGGVADDCIVVNAHEVGDLTLGGITWYAVEFTLRVLGKGA